MVNSKFGPFAGQILIGDQTQSNLLRVVTQKVDDLEQGCVIPFFEGLESGVMRPVFLPDGSLLLGQTGRGWQAKGGKVASLQHVRWDGKTVAPAILAMSATAEGFRIDLTQPLGAGVDDSILRSAISLESWTYRDAPAYGSDELDLREESAPTITVSPDRKSLHLVLGLDARSRGASSTDRPRLSRQDCLAGLVRRARPLAARRVLHPAALPRRDARQALAAPAAR